MNKRTTQTADFLILNIVIELTGIILLPFLINHSFKAIAPLDLAIVVLFALIYVFSTESADFWPTPRLIYHILLLIPILLLLWQKMLIIALLLFMQYVIYLMTDRTPRLNNKLTRILEQGVIPLFLTITVLDTVVESMTINDVLLIAGLYLIKVMFSFPIKNFLDFLWPFIGIVTVVLLGSTHLLSLPAAIMMVIILLASTITYPKRRNLSKFPTLLLITLTLVSLI
ncbi:hypothetical protein [Lapidilactobacillus bayanensis]|uniref:hypothetical protein n=1 Tax=Lapidilactobacillus bayanensis TaxID=2485998 RepID=UPI000F7AD393|nr:hypothetical protein [Lapidilactobacillus bayanensis]